MDTSGTDDAQQVAIQNDSSMQESSTQSISPAPSAGLNPFHNVRIFLDVCSGRTRPLSTALKNCNVDVLSFDILLDPQMNLLDDTVFLQLLKLCASGVVAYGAFSPSCGEYSRLKLRPGGPPPLRDPDHLDGLPGLDCHSTMKLQNSFTMLDRCCQCLIALYSSGGHGHLEQPPTAMSWQEPSVQQWLLYIRGIVHSFGSLCIWSQLEQILDVRIISQISPIDGLCLYSPQVLRSTTPVLILYYEVLLQYYSVLQLYYKQLLQYYSVLQSTTPVLLRTTKYYSSTTPYYKVPLQYYCITTLYYKVLLQYYSVLQSTTPVLLCTTKYYSIQYYSVLQSTTPVLVCTTKYYSSTCLYYKVLLQYYSVLQSTTPVLLCTTKYHSSTTPYYRTTQIYSSTTPYYKVLLQYYSVLHRSTPQLLRTTKYYSSTSPYYKVLLQYYSVLQSTTKYYSSTTPYNKVLLQYYSVLQNTTLYYKVLLRYYSLYYKVLICKARSTNVTNVTKCCACHAK